MKKKRVIRLILIGTVAILFIGGIIFNFRNLLFKAQEGQAPLGPATINIDATKITGQINDDVFGLAVGAESSAFFQPGYCQTIKDSGSKLLRIHGGSWLSVDPNDQREMRAFNFAIGPVSERYNLAKVGDPETYPSGPDEWGKCGQIAGTDLSITLPFVDGSAKWKNQFKNLVEYMNVSLTDAIRSKATAQNWQVNLLNPDGVNSWGGYDSAPAGYFAWLRVQVNGGNDPGPYNVKYWEIGNEIYYDIYKVYANDYADKAIEIAESMKAVDPTIKIGAVVTREWWQAGYDADNVLPKPVIWDEEVLKKVVAAGLANRSNPPIDFVIPHYYYPVMYTDQQSIAKTFNLFNPKKLNYLLANGSSANIPQENVNYVEDVTLSPGQYTFSIDGYGISLPDGANDVAPNLKLRLIDDGGEGNLSTDSTVTIQSPAEVLNAGEINVANSPNNVGTYKFSSSVEITKPTQKYRLELIFTNPVYRPTITQTDYSAQASQTLIHDTDYVAQSFVANDKTVNSASFYLQRSANISQNDLDNNKVAVDLYADSNGQPDMANSLGSYMVDKDLTLSKMPIIDDPYYVTQFVKKDPNQAISVIEGQKYWFVLHLNSSLTDINSSVRVFGNPADNYADGEAMSQTGRTEWNDSNLKDLFFTAHTYVSRGVWVKDLKITDQNQNEKYDLLSEKDWLESLETSGDRSKDDITKIKDFSAGLNSEYRTSHPGYSGTDFIPDIITTEYSMSSTGGTLPNEQSVNRMYYPALYDANQLITFIQNGLMGATIWSASDKINIYRYQDPWSLFYINSIDRGSPEPDNPDLYLYNPRYDMLKLMATNRGSALVDTNISSPQFTYDINNGWFMLPNVFSNDSALLTNCNTDAGKAKYPNYWQCNPNLLRLPQYQSPYLKGITSIDQKNKKLYLTVVNSNVTQDIVSNINLKNFVPGNTIDVQTLDTENGNNDVNTMNGPAVKLTEPVAVDSNEIKVTDPTIFRIGDLISIQATCSGREDFFKIVSIDGNKLTLNDLVGKAAKIQCYGSDWRSSYDKYCAPYTCAEVVRVTNRTGVTKSSITGGKSLVYNFPAHSVSVLEISELDMKEPVLNSGGLNNINDKTGKITFTGSAEPLANISLKVQSDPINLTGLADSSGNWSIELDQALESGQHIVQITSTIDYLSKKSQVYTFAVSKSESNADSNTVTTYPKDQSNNITNNNNTTNNTNTDTNKITKLTATGEKTLNVIGLAALVAIFIMVL